MSRVELPGLVDLQVNGYRGIDVNAPDVDAGTVGALTRALWEVGTTTYLPTIITAPEPRILASIRAVVSAREADPLVAHSVAGIHVEGPFISGEPGAVGAHDPDSLRAPDLAELDRWQDAAGGLVRIVTIAPELPGAVDFVTGAVERGVLASLGHTAATAGQVLAAIDAGATLSTHLGNGAPQLLPRHPNHIWAQLADDRLTAMLITDGHHLPADTATVMMRAKGPGRVLLTSDSAALAGMDPGVHETPVGGRVQVTGDGRLLLHGSELLAGSGSSLLDCLAWALGSLPFEEQHLVDMATANPARILGVEDRVADSGDRVLLEQGDGGLRVVRATVLGQRVV
ncbi:N-acetylglucosamine-6-phosphate deacetylase [Tessaracoccus terricola]